MNRPFLTIIRRLLLSLGAFSLVGSLPAQVKPVSSGQSPTLHTAPAKEIPLLLEFELVGSDPSQTSTISGIAISQDGKVLCPRKSFLGVNKVLLKKRDGEKRECPGWLAQDLGQDWIVLQSSGTDYQPALMGASTQVPLSPSDQVLLSYHTTDGETRIELVAQSSPPENQKLEAPTKGFWISTATHNPLPGTYVLNVKGLLLGLVTTVLPDRHLAHVERLFGPLELLEEASVEPQPNFWKDLETGLPPELSLTDPTISAARISTILQKPVDGNTSKLCDNLLSEKSQSALAWYVASLGYARLHQDEQALASAHQVTILAPEAWEGWALYGQLLTEGSKFDQALDIFQTAADQGAPLKVVGVPIEVCLEHSGNFNLVAQRIQQLIEQEPRLYAAWLLEGRLQVANNQWPKATQAYVKALRLNPQSITAWTSLAAIYDHLQDWKNSIEAYQILILLLPDQPDLWYNLGLAQKKLGHAPEARTSFEQTVALNPKDRDSWLQITRLDYESKNWPDLKVAGSKVLELDPKNEEVRKALADIPAKDG